MRKNPIFDIDSIKRSHTAQYPPTSALKQYRVRIGKGKTLFGERALQQMIDARMSQIWRPKSSLTINDLIALAACGEATLNTNKEIKGKPRRALRLAVNRAKRTVQNA